MFFIIHIPILIGMDEDVDAGIILRFTKDQNLKSYHRLQHIYAWFLYGLLTISWLVSKDIIQLIKYNKRDLLKTQGTSFSKAIISLIFWKSIYVFLILVLPTLITGNLGLNIAGFFIMEFIAGFFLTTVLFLCAHIVDQTDFPKPNNEGVLQKTGMFISLKLLQISPILNPFFHGLLVV